MTKRVCADVCSAGATVLTDTRDYCFPPDVQWEEALE